MALAGWLVAGSVPAVAQTVSCEPESARAGREFGCFITAREELGRLAAEPPPYWHIDAYATRSAAEEARGPRGTVVESLGQIWLFTIAEEEWRPADGRRVVEIGPLPLVPADTYAAVYMEGLAEMRQEWRSGSGSKGRGPKKPKPPRR